MVALFEDRIFARLFSLLSGHYYLWSLSGILVSRIQRGTIHNMSLTFIPSPFSLEKIRKPHVTISAG